MPSIIATENKKQALLAGLNWVTVQSSGKKRLSEIRSVARQAEATHLLQLSRSGQTFLGLFAEEEVEFDFNDLYVDAASPAKARHKKAKHSMAAAFARMAGPGFALLLYTVRESGEVVLVVANEGVPQADEVKQIDDARDAADNYAQGANGFEYAVYSNDLTNFPAATPITDEQLFAACGRHTKLGSVPVNVPAILAGAVALAVLVAGWVMWSNYEKEQRLRKFALEQAAADPLPRYQQALAPALVNLGMPRQEVHRLLDIVFQYPVRSAGWDLKEVTCEQASKTCVSVWERKGGTTQELLQARQVASEVAAPGDWQAGRARLVRKVDMQTAGVPSAQALSPFAQVKQSAVELTQMLESAGLTGATASVAGATFVRWPVVPDITMTSLPPTAVVRAAPMTLKVDAALARRLIDVLPSWFWVQKVHVTLTSGSGGGMGAEIELSGMSYAK